MTEAALPKLADITGAHVPDRQVKAEVNQSFRRRLAADSSLILFGHAALMTLMAILVRGRPELELRMAGRGKDMERARQIAGELGIAKNVRVIGAVDEEQRRRLFAGAAVQLMPSRFEGFGMVAAEAMAAGVPLVAAAAGSLPEVVAPPEGGVLVPPGDAQALANAVSALLDDPARRAALSASARISAGRFSWEAVADRHFEFLARLATTPFARPPRLGAERSG